VEEEAVTEVVKGEEPSLVQEAVTEVLKGEQPSLEQEAVTETVKGEEPSVEQETVPSMEHKPVPEGEIVEGSPVASDGNHETGSDIHPGIDIITSIPVSSSSAITTSGEGIGFEYVTLHTSEEPSGLSTTPAVVPTYGVVPGEGMIL
jgi:hypothetical protein